MLSGAAEELCAAAGVIKAKANRDSRGVSFRLI
jgi:hypothetical protein